MISVGPHKEATAHGSVGPPLRSAAARSATQDWLSGGWWSRGATASARPCRAHELRAQGARLLDSTSPTSANAMEVSAALDDEGGSPRGARNSRAKRGGQRAARPHYPRLGWCFAHASGKIADDWKTFSIILFQILKALVKTFPTVPCSPPRSKTKTSYRHGSGRGSCAPVAL